MTIVALALRRPITVIVMVLALAMGGLWAVQETPKDILPQLGIPTIFVAQPYGGMSPAQMEGFLTYYYEYHFLYLTGIEHVESKSISGASLIKLQFHPGTNMIQAVAETVSYVNRARAFMPAGTVPPFIMRFDAGSLPVGNLVFSSKTRSLPEIQDAALNRVRPLFATLPGVSAPPPFGGNARSLVVRVDPHQLQTRGLSAEKIVEIVSAANPITPAGSVRFGDKNPLVDSNFMVGNPKDLEDLPIQTGPQGTVFLRDVAKIEDASDIPTGYALIDGKRTVYIPVTKRAGASTLAVADRVKANLQKFRKVLPEDVQVDYLFDQSPVVVSALRNLLVEIVLGACLTGLMVLLFLRDWRSALVVVLNIPLALLAAVLGLWAMNESLNVMTLGGLALAVGILVDEATVTVESIHYHQAMGKSVHRAVSDSGREVALPLFVSMLCILAVFFPSLLMKGASGALFGPLAKAVGLSMIASYLLSRTFVPVLSCWLLKGSAAGENHDSKLSALTGFVMPLGWIVGPIYLVISGILMFSLTNLLGRDIFPVSDSGQLQLRLKAPTGTRLEVTEELARQVSERFTKEVPGTTSLGFVGTQPSSYPVSNIFLWTSGPEEAVLQFQCPGRSEPLKDRFRSLLKNEFPQLRVSFEPSSLIDRVLSFGSATPIEVAISGPVAHDNREFAEKVIGALGQLPSLRDVQLTQALDYPTLKVNVDKLRAADQGTSTASVSRSLVVGTSSSRFTVPNYWADAKSGIAYQLQVEVPFDKMKSREDLLNLPITTRDGSTALRNLASVNMTESPAEYDRYNMQRYLTVTANLGQTDLGSAADEVRKALRSLGSPPAKVEVALRGQIPPLEQLQSNLMQGIGLTILFLLGLLAANFQSLRLSLVVLSPLPAALVGSLASLWLFGETLNLQSLMGCIMVLGVAVANSILLVSSCVSFQSKGSSALEASREGLKSRVRPILMTSLAMQAGMLPMALGSNGPLGKAVIGGLMAATVVIFTIVPSIYAALQSKSSGNISLDPDDPGSSAFDGSVNP